MMLAYPLIVYLGLSRWSTRTVSLVLLGVLLPTALVRLRRVGARALRGLILAPLAMVACLALGVVLNASGFVLVVPVAANVVLLAAFGVTLRRGAVPMIERFARLKEPVLPLPKLRWCRQWTIVWCVFFAFNGAMALVLALVARLEAWTVYNGFVAYVLIGLLVAIEWVARRVLFDRPNAVQRPS
jgi:uncharacterized membrane protein